MVCHWFGHRKFLSFNFYCIQVLLPIVGKQNFPGVRGCPTGRSSGNRAGCYGQTICSCLVARLNFTFALSSHCPRITLAHSTASQCRWWWRSQKMLRPTGSSILRSASTRTSSSQRFVALHNFIATDKTFIATDKTFITMDKTFIVMEKTVR